MLDYHIKQAHYQIIRSDALIGLVGLADVVGLVDLGCTFELLVVTPCDPSQALMSLLIQLLH